MSRTGGGTDLDWSLYDALNCAALSLLMTQEGNGPKAREAWMEASVAALGAFPDGGPEAAALHVLLGEVGERARNVPDDPSPDEDWAGAGFSPDAVPETEATA